MKRKLFYHLLIILLFSGTRLFAQGTNPPVFSIAAEYTKLIPTSPEAETMAKYGIIPVTLYTGMPNVSIPIYNIRWGSLTLPINLSYNNNGLKPIEDASRVGWGWCLNAGGVITRVVNGMVDESVNSRRFDSYPNLYDFNFAQAILDSIVNGKTDGEPDVYIFNFNGITGKFIYINGKAYFSCQQDVKISMIGDDFQIITEDGTIYDFREKETTSSHQLQGGFIPSYTSAWFLSSITSKDGKDIITFSYTAKPYQRNSVFSDSYKEGHGYLGNVTKTFSTNLVSTSVTINKELVSVNYGANSVQFIEDETIRLDIENNTDKRALKSICVYDNNSALTKKFNLITGYFGTNSKLKLNEVRQVDNTDKLLSSYIFSYYNDGTLPVKNTRGIDYWGFYNGKDINQSLISQAESNSSLGGDRSPDFASAQKGVLNTITFPTGGTTTFEYEPNYYSNGTVQNVFVPHSTSTTTFFNNSNNGAPVTTSIDFNINVGQFIYFTYSRNIPNFSSNGVKSFNPIVKIMDGSVQLYSRIINYMHLQESDSLYLPIGNYTMILSCESTAVSTYATLSYKEQTQQVSPGTLGPGVRVKSITSDDKISGKTIVKNYTYTNENGTSSGYLNSYVGDGVITTNWQTSTEQGYNLIYNADGHSGIGGMTENEFYYNRVTETTSDGTVTGKTTNDFRALYSSIASVVPVKETHWKTTTPGTFTKVKETTYNYDLVSTKDVIGVKSRLSGFLNGLDGFSASPDPLDIVAHTQIYVSNALLMSFVYYRVKSETDNTYSDDPNDPNINTSTKNYYYNSKYSAPSLVFDKNSKGERILSRSVFPNNYPLLPSNVLTPDQIEDNYNNAMGTASSNFASGRSNAMDYCLPSHGQYWTDQDFINRVNASNSYISAYFNAYRQATADRINSLSTYYTSINNTIAQSSDQNTKALLIMQRDHIVSSPVEQMTYKKISNSSFLTAAIKSSYGVAPDNVPVIESIWTTELTSPIDSASFATSDYKKKIEFTYDNDFKLVQQKKVNDVPRSYLWDYSKQYPVAEVINASHGDIAYTSFEADETGGWYVGSSSRNTSYALTGKRSYDLSNGALSASVSTATSYILSYWSRNVSYSISGGSIVNTTQGKTINGWTLYEHELTSTGGTLTITGSGLIDEVRLYPKGAQMTSLTYAPLVGMTSQNDAKNSITYYNYDTFGRLSNITDGDQNILKEHTYNYGTNPSNNLFYNTERSQSFSKSGCGDGYHGSGVTYTVPLGRYSSSISQAAADQLAQNDIDANGQNNANALGSCISNATHAVSIGLDPSITLSNIGLCTITIRDAGNNTILLNRTTTSGLMFFKPTSIAPSSNGYYTVTITPDASIPITVTVNSVYKDLFSTQTWSQVSGDISILISPYINCI